MNFKFKSSNKSIFDWIEPKGREQLRSQIMYGDASFWNKISTLRILSWLFLFFLFSWLFYNSRVEDGMFDFKVLCISILVSIGMICLLEGLGFLLSLFQDDRISVYKDYITIHTNSNIDQIKYSKLSSVEFLSGVHEGRNTHIMVLKEAEKIKKVIFISDEILADHIKTLFENTGMPINDMNLSDHLMQRGIKTTSVSGAGHSSKIFRYPMEVCLGYLGMSILSIAILSFVVYSGYNGSVDKKNEEYYWIAAVALFALVMLVFLFQYIKYSQKLYFDKPFLVQKDVFSGIIKLNLLDGAVWKFTADSDLMLKDTKTRMYINTKLINFYSFCTEVETISGLHILKTLHQDQQKKMMMRLKTENHSA